MRKRHFFAIPVLSLLAVGLSSAPSQAGPELIEERHGHEVRPIRRQPNEWLIRRLKLPAGFEIKPFATGLGEPRMLATSAAGTVFVTRRQPGDVVALRDRNGDGRADWRKVVVRGLPEAHGIALRGNKMYICTVRALYVADRNGTRVGKPRRLLGDLPRGGRHPNRTIAFGPDAWLYISIGSTCNACVEESRESAAIIRVRPDGSRRSIFARGLRNTVGFDWHPQTREMWGMDHGTDWLGDDYPPEELNRLEQGKFYGWPFVYGHGNVIDLSRYPSWFDRQAMLARSIPMARGYQAHSAPIQMAFYTHDQFPAEYKGDAFVAMRGSWNRRPPVGYEVLRTKFDNGRPVGFETFLSGFLFRQNDGRWAHFARLAGLAVDRYGSLLVGDDTNGVIYRVTYRGKK